MYCIGTIFLFALHTMGSANEIYQIVVQTSLKGSQCYKHATSMTRLIIGPSSEIQSQNIPSQIFADVDKKIKS